MGSPPPYNRVQPGGPHNTNSPLTLSPALWMATSGAMTSVQGSSTVTMLGVSVCGGPKQNWGGPVGPPPNSHVLPRPHHQCVLQQGRAMHPCRQP